MFGSKKKIYKEMTTEEKIKAIHKVPYDDLRNLLDEELSPEERKVINDEIVRRDVRDDKLIMGSFAVVAVSTLVTLLCSSSDDM